MYYIDSQYIINLCINLYSLLRHFHQNNRLLRYIWRLFLRTDHCYKQTSLQDKMEEMYLNEKNKIIISISLKPTVRDTRMQNMNM